MLSLKEFIKENNKINQLPLSEFMEEAFGFEYFGSQDLILEESNNDAHGKLHEILVGSHLLNGVNDDGTVHTFMQHTRSHAKGPAAAHGTLVSKIGGIKSEKYKQINDSAKALSEKIKESLPAGHTIHQVHWSSQPSDYAAITGRNRKSKSDIIVSTKDAEGNIIHHPVSLKFTKSEPNFSNNGLDSLSTHFGIESGTLQKHANSIIENSNHLHDGPSGVEKNQKFKIDDAVSSAYASGKDPRAAVENILSDSSSKSEPKHRYRAESARLWLSQHDKEGQGAVDKSIQRTNAAKLLQQKALTSIANELHMSASRLSDEDHRALLAKIATSQEEKDGTPDILAVSKINTNGSTTPLVGYEHHLVHSHLNSFRDIQPSVSGNSVTYHGIHKETGKRHPIAVLNLKGANGIYQGINSTLTLPGFYKHLNKE